MMLANGQAAPFGPSDHLPLARFLETVASSAEQGARLLAYFGMANPASNSAADQVVLIAALGWDENGRIEVLSSRAGAEVPSLAGRIPAAARFEREIAEQLGIVLAGHGDPRPIRGENGARAAPEAAYAFHPIVNPSVHEVAVGPVHAGVIEPGHFRFQCLGETVLQLEIMLGYQHRGAERALLGEPGGRQLAAVQELAGDTTVGHTLAYCQLIEAMGGTRAPPRALAIRACALELERM
ncbi:MAG TPA: NADH-quinone oxidoreductase subunit C, partial [Longimicrobiales bacterium]|nr:NADH-quinone oxidoreductase subunit C [Longimicrobiales bacterium]